MREKYSVKRLIRDMEKRTSDIFLAGFRIVSEIERKGEEELKEYMEKFILRSCPSRRCAVLNGKPWECPDQKCWIAEGPTWKEFLSPELELVYDMLIYTYLDALDIPEDPAEEIRLKEDPLNIMNERLKSNGEVIIEAFEKAKVFEPRVHIIKDALWAHNENKYTLSVPLLIIQIEGILHDIAYYLKWEFRKEEMYRSHSAKVWALIKRLGEKSIEDALVNFYTGGEESPRNLIIHGRFVDYGKNHRLSTALFTILIYLIAFYQMKTHGATILNLEC